MTKPLAACAARTFGVLVSVAALLTATPSSATPPLPPSARTDAPVLRWGGDAEGGAPFVEADPGNPANLRGFDVEVAALLAQGLGRRPQFVQVAWSSIDASVRRGDFEIGMSGVEDMPARRQQLAVTVPYFEFKEVLAVRVRDRGRYSTLASLKGRRIGTLGGTLAYDLLQKAEREHGVVPVTYEDDVHPYTDLEDGRLDAVLLDHIIAARAMTHHRGLTIEPTPVATGHYVGVLAPANVALRDRINGILLQAMRDGRLERIFRTWKIWDDDEAAFVGRMAAATPDDAANDATAAHASQTVPPTESEADTASAPSGMLEATRRYLPAVLRASLVTVLLSCVSMALAVALGVVVASGRLYSGRLVRTALTAYVEVTRGTPVLLQLFVIYYGLSSVVRLPAFVAAWIGLGLNYAAYESEIYRSALLAVPPGQLEAARALGLTEGQVLRLVRAPQAFRIALAPMTNDFVALLKDSSLVSVITVIELTKQTQIFAANIGSWVVPGLLCASLYLAMSLPLSRLARWLEERWAVSR